MEEPTSDSRFLKGLRKLSPCGGGGLWCEAFLFLYTAERKEALGLIFVLFTRYLRGSMNCTFVVSEFSVTPPEMIKKKLWEKAESSFFSLHLDFESVVVSS